MKRGWKIFWIVCASVLMLGLILCITGAAMGGTTSYVANAFEHHMKRFIVMHNDWDDNDSYDDYGDTEDIPISGSDASEFEGVRELDLEVSYLQVIVKQGEGDAVLVDTSHMDKRLSNKIKIKQDDGELSIKSTDRSLFRELGRNHADRLIIQLPKNRTLEDASFGIGAGQLTIEALNADSLDIEVGAGQAIAEQFEVKNLDVKCGAGQVKLDGSAARKTKIDCGVGEVDVILSGNQNDFDYELEYGIGEVKIGHDTYAGIGSKKHIDNGNKGTDRKIDIECSVGSVEMSFRDDK